MPAGASSPYSPVICGIAVGFSILVCAAARCYLAAPPHARRDSELRHAHCRTRTRPFCARVVLDSGSVLSGSGRSGYSSRSGSATTVLIGYFHSILLSWTLHAALRTHAPAHALDSIHATTLHAGARHATTCSAPASTTARVRAPPHPALARACYRTCTARGFSLLHRSLPVLQFTTFAAHAAFSPPLHPFPEHYWTDSGLRTLIPVLFYRSCPYRLLPMPPTPPYLPLPFGSIHTALAQTLLPLATTAPDPVLRNSVLVD